MCLVAVALQVHPRFPLVLASNRDEFFDRPTAPMAWWTPAPPAPPWLAGRDLRAGGTWLAVGAAGRLGLVTNVRDGHLPPVGAPSRGAIVPAWVGTSTPVDTFATELAQRGYAGFNALLGDWSRAELAWCGTRQARAVALPPGLHGLSNADLDTPWPKVERIKAALARCLDNATDPERLCQGLLRALDDAHPAAVSALPDTGIPRDLERQLSAIRIRTADGRYGTRAATVVIAERIDAGRCRAHVIERTLPADPAGHPSDIGFVCDAP